MHTRLHSPALPALFAFGAACSSGAAPPALTPDTGTPTHDSGTPKTDATSNDSGHVTKNDGAPQSGAFSSYNPKGCSYTVTPAANLGYMGTAYDDDSSAGSGSAAAPARVRLGLGGNVTAGQAGYADPTTTAVLTWETGAANHAAKVQFGVSANSFTTVQSGYVWTLPPSGLASGSTYMHEVHLCGLAPATTYYYQVGGGAPGAEIWGKTQSFATLPSSAADSITLAVGGDARDQVNVWQLANQRMKTHNVDAILFSGDLTLLGSDESAYTNWLDAIWDPNSDGQFVTSGQVMFLPVAGNHEFDDATSMTDVQWASAFAMPGSGPYAKSFGSYNIGNSHFVYIDDSELATVAQGADNPQVDAQLAWLKADLAAADSDRTSHPFIFVYNHRGLYSTSNHASDPDVLQARTTLAPIFAQYKVDGVFNGHDHEYERTVPIVPGNPVANDPTAQAGGTVYVICAGVGALPYAVGTGTQAWRGAKVAFGSVGTTPAEMAYQGVFSTLTLSGSTATLNVYALTSSGTDTMVDTYAFTH